MPFLSGYTDRWLITIDSTKVPSTLTDYQVFVDLTDLPDDFWNIVGTDGADIRVTAADGVTEVPREVVVCEELTIDEEIVYITSSQEWVCPAGVTEVTVEAWGGGGGGGDGSSTGGGGGGGGAYASSVVSVTPSTSYTITVGSGGPMLTNFSAPGGDGEDSSFESDVIAKGGTGGGGGVSVNTTGGAGGSAAASTGTIKYSGGDGGGGLNSGDIGGGGGGAAGSSGNGGNGGAPTAGLGTGEGGNGGTGGLNGGFGSFGIFPGGGGGGGEINASTGYPDRGLGAAGQVKLTYAITPYTVRKGELHFLASSLPSSTDTEFYIYANGTSADYAATDTYGRNAVWPGYTAVFHLNSDGTNSTGGTDLTQNNSPAYVSTPIGDGTDSLVSSLSVYDTITYNANHFTAFDNYGFASSKTGTVTMVAKINSTSTGLAGLFGNCEGDLRAGYNLTYFNGELTFVWDKFGVGGGGSVTETVDLVDGDFHILHGWANDTTLGLYRNGISKGSSAYSGEGTGGTALTDGTSVHGLLGWSWQTTARQVVTSHSTITEVRISEGVLPEERSVTDNNNLLSASTFYTVGATESVGGVANQGFVVWLA